METIALVGPIDIDAKAKIREIIPKGFKIKEVPTEDEFDQLHDADYIILRTLKLDEKTIYSIPNLKLIQRWGVGYDTVDIKAAGERNIPVAITAGINAAPVSEFAVLLMLAVYRNIIGLHNNVIQGKWREGNFISRSYLINGKTVGLIGLGSVGKQVVPKVKSFGAKVQYYDVVKLSQDEENRMEIKYVGFEELIKTSDIISLHVPLTKDTYHLICKDTIDMMKPTAIIVNTSRGSIIKEDDLVEALQSGRILGAALDVYENEPVISNNTLLKLKNVVLAPHSGGNTADNTANMANRCISNIVKVSKGERLSKSDVVNSEYLKY